MPPEEPGCVVAIKIGAEGNAARFVGWRVFAWSSKSVTTTWYTTGETPNGYESVLEGLVFVRSSTVEDRSEIKSGDLCRRDERLTWKDTAPPEGLMIAAALPKGTSLADPTPRIEEAKVFQSRIAIYWYLYPSAAGDRRVEVSFRLAALVRPLDEEALRLNRQSDFARNRPLDADYDVALSFAGEQRTYVEKVAELLQSEGVKIFYDKFEEVDLWGKDLYEHLSDVYHRRARFTVMFLSRAYAEKVWTTHERKAAQAKAFNSSEEYILPVRFDDTEVPGVLPTTAYLNAHDKQPKELARVIMEKLKHAPRAPAP